VSGELDAAFLEKGAQKLKELGAGRPIERAGVKRMPLSCAHNFPGPMCSQCANQIIGNTVEENAER